MTLASFAPLLPELVLAAGALGLLMLGALRGEGARGLVNALAIGLLALAAVLLLLQEPGRVVALNGSFVSDAFGRYMKVLALLGSIAAIVLALDKGAEEGLARFEYGIIVVLASVGMMLMISAGDLIMVYLGLELMSLALYVSAAFHRDDLRSTEAGLKYFVLGALASGMLLYGASFVYGFTGTVNFAGIAEALSKDKSTGVVFGLVFVVAALAFKISAVPFHMWTPDVYEGAPTPVAAFFSAGPKMAAMAMLARVLLEAFPGLLRDWQQVLTFIAVGSMGLGAFAAIGQSNIRRLMAYSSIGNMGYAVVGLASGTREGAEAVAFFMAVYLAMTLGVFACILAMRTEAKRFETIDDLSGLSRTRPGLALALLLLMVSLIGLPPLGGFWAKFVVFAAAVQAGLVPLAVIGVLASAVSAYYYLRIVKVMYFDPSREPFAPLGPAVRGVMVACVAVVVVVGVVPGPLRAAAATAARSLFPG